jgi:hypothetical protein
MPRNSAVYEVLIASPGDVVSERVVVAEVVEDWNAANASHFGIMLQSRRWELDSRPELGERPQAIINRQIVNGSDILIAMFSTKLGSPTGVSASGTAEEIERLRSMDKPVLVYFSKAPLARTHDPDQLKRLNEYKSELREKGLYCEFETDEDLRRQVSRHLAGTMSALAKAAQNQKPPQTTPSARVSLVIGRQGRSGDVRTVPVSVELENLSPVRRITEYVVTLSVPRACLTHSSASYIREIRGAGPERRVFRTTEDDENLILPGDKATLFSLELGIDQLMIAGTRLAGDIEAVKADKVTVEAVVGEERFRAEMTVAEIFRGVM